MNWGSSRARSGKTPGGGGAVRAGVPHVPAASAMPVCCPPRRDNALGFPCVPPTLRRSFPLRQTPVGSPISRLLAVVTGKAAGLTLSDRAIPASGSSFARLFSFRRKVYLLGDRADRPMPRQARRGKRLRQASSSSPGVGNIISFPRCTWPPRPGPIQIHSQANANSPRPRWLERARQRGCSGKQGKRERTRG